MPVLEAKHLRRMGRKRLRFGMPDSVAFAAQQFESGRSGNTKVRILFSSAQAPDTIKMDLIEQVETRRSISPGEAAVVVDAGFISAHEDGFKVAGNPTEVYPLPMGGSRDSLDARVSTFNFIEGKTKSGLTVFGDLQPIQR